MSGAYQVIPMAFSFVDILLFSQTNTHWHAFYSFTSIIKKINFREPDELRTQYKVYGEQLLAIAVGLFVIAHYALIHFLIKSCTINVLVGNQIFWIWKRRLTYV